MVILEGTIYYPMAAKTWPCHPTSALKGQNRKAQGVQAVSQLFWHFVPYFNCRYVILQAHYEREFLMAYRYGDRKQIEMFPPCLDDYVPKDAPVRAYDALITVMDLAAMGFRYDPSQVGNSSYDPRAMLKLLVYGYSYGVCSSRKLERECHYNLSFLWLMGGLKPDHKTIAEFRRRNQSALQKVIQQCARSCIELGLVA